MGRYSLSFRRSVAKDLRTIPNADVARILERIGELAESPRGPGSEKLSTQERYRVRQGSCRILYRIDDARQMVLVVKVAHRGGAYK